MFVNVNIFEEILSRKNLVFTETIVSTRISTLKPIFRDLKATVERLALKDKEYAKILQKLEDKIDILESANKK